jgi:glycosyltransferase involved in cell wall biosynthesis
LWLRCDGSRDLSRETRKQQDTKADDDNAQPHILAILHHYHPNFSGAAKQARRCYARLAAQGFSVTVLTRRDRRAKGLPREEVLDGVNVYRLPVISPPASQRFAALGRLARLLMAGSAMLSELSFSLSCIWALWRKAKRPGIVQIYGCSEFKLLIVYASRLLGLHPVIRMSLMGLDDPGAIRRKPLGWLKFRAFSTVEAVVSISTPMTDSYLHAGLDPRKLVQIPNGVDCSVFHPVSSDQKQALRDRLGLNAKTPYIVFVGSAQLRKGVDILLKAFTCIASRVPDVSLLIVGPSDFSDTTRYRPERNQHVAAWREQMDKAGLSERVMWTGQVDNVVEYLQAADIFCLPSRREGMPSAVLEAMAVGLPAVVSSLDGISADIISSGQDGIIVEGEEPEAYAEQLLFLLENPQEAEMIASHARQRIEEAFTLDKGSSQYAALYQRLACV